MARSPWLLALLATHVCGAVAQEQLPFQLDAASSEKEAAPKATLHGRFLHITDIHPDPHYVPSTKAKRACHRGKGKAGVFGSEGTDCDSPLALADATFKWIADNLSDSIDFVIWTGDSARHDLDEKIPRTEKEVIYLNQAMADGLRKAVADKSKRGKRARIPIVPTLGNNDMMPHNIFRAGPNRWTKAFLQVWDKFIPEEQRHSFVEGGWFYVEVIPNKLAVFSLNTMYFFDSNNAVDGCNHKAEPGYEHMEWLRIQLQFMRDRGMKAILIGHVPPARTSSKQSWDESCWQKYSLWLRQYRDVVVGSVYGHMNIDHFMLQDFKDLKIGDEKANFGPGEGTSGEISINSKTSYLRDLRDLWADLPSPPPQTTNVDGQDENALKAVNGKTRKKYFRQIGGKWAERYSVSLVSPSVVPNYFPSLRIIEYNVTGLEGATLWSQGDMETDRQETLIIEEDREFWESDADASKKKGRKKKHKKKKNRKGKKPPKFTIPNPPSSTAPPGPAYSNQPFTWLSYTQLFANLTEINANSQKLLEEQRRPLSWREYLSQKNDAQSANDYDKMPFKYELEYDTRTDDAFKLEDLTVKNYLKLARKIAKRPFKAADNSTDGEENDSDFKAPDLREGTARFRNQVWKVFLRRAFVGLYGDDELGDMIQ